jgi:pimeloyl-ACP methyl ester carboxylesterase
VCSSDLSERFMREKPDRLEEFIRVALNYVPTRQGAAGQVQALSVFNVKRRLGEIRCPVLVITGSEDGMMPSENSRLLAEAIPGARFFITGGAGHNFFHEQPEEVSAVLIDFFKGISTNSSGVPHGSP